MSNDVENLRKLWKEHLSSPFPDESKGKDINGIELVLLEADIAGCLSGFLGSQGKMEQPKIEILKKCSHDLNSIIDLINTREKSYFIELGKITLATLRLLN